MPNQTITAIKGLKAGHAQSAKHHTGCTVILCPEGFTPGVHVPGFAPSCREIELLRPEAAAPEIHGLVLAGGSAFGLAAAEGVVKFLREAGAGLRTPHMRIPLVSAAVIYDLEQNKSLKPDAAMGYAAAKAASAEPLASGRVGVGCGARCGRMFARSGLKDRSCPAGVGCALQEYEGLQAAAVVAVNALGNVHDPHSGAFLAGARDDQGQPLSWEEIQAALAGPRLPRNNTVLAVVATNAVLTKAQTSRLARMAASGLARTIRPAHLTFDGDVVFALSARSALKKDKVRENLLGALAAEAVAQAVVRAVRA